MASEALAAAAARKHHATLERGRVALRALDDSGAPINFQAVARTGNVSRQWLYQQPDLRHEIERLRDRGQRARTRVPDAQRSTEASLRQRVQSLLDENRRLRDQATQLRAELALVYGEQRSTRPIV
jgi:hypothetical protein